MSNFNLLLVKNSQIEGERILLRPISFNDAEDMFEYTSDEETTRFLYSPHKDLEQTQSMIANYFVKEPIGKYAIVLKDSNKMIGAIEFRVDDWNKSGDLGFTLNRKYWGNGYMTEAGKLILELAFKELGLERVHAAHDVINSASGKVLLHLGMQREGTLRKSEMIKGVLADSAYYSILKDEYSNAGKKEQ
ncbi:GNAT family N-acetyltransferase [Psychrobacillus sp. FSL K6-2684]|uniref:GNAT family N-acetyltransferase n=1 Tax=Psychrobacillus sp. FSL K6-2684 TaxID=2921547 RepID=UPI0030F645DD